VTLSGRPYNPLYNHDDEGDMASTNPATITVNRP
jgi:hypothetical protein